MTLESNIERLVGIEIAKIEREREKQRILQERLDRERDMLLRRRKHHMKQWLSFPDCFSVRWEDGKKKEGNNATHSIIAFISYKEVTVRVEAYEKLSQYAGKHKEEPKWIFHTSANITYGPYESVPESEWRVVVKPSDPPYSVCASIEEMHVALEKLFVKGLVWNRTRRDNS